MKSKSFFFPWLKFFDDLDLFWGIMSDDKTPIQMGFTWVKTLLKGFRTPFAPLKTNMTLENVQFQ